MAEVKYNLGTLSTIPVGAILPYAGSTAPEGYLLCDGRTVNKADYPYLFDVIGTTYGGDDTTFTLPNLQDKFIQGSGTNTVGTEMSAGLPNITGGFATYDFISSSTTGCFKRRIINPTNSSTSMNSTNNPYVHFDLNASNSSSIYGKSDTVQPPAICMNYIIKY